MMASIRFACRRLAKSPGFTATTVATLALCLAANIAIFAFVDAVLLRPLPFPHPERLLDIGNGYLKIGLEPGGASIPNYFDRRHSIPALESVSICGEGSVVVGGVGAADRAQILKVSPEFLQTLQVPLALGHGFTDEALDLASDGVAILTDGFWKRRFQADPKVVGRTFVNDGKTVTVIGVLPFQFQFLGEEIQFLRPLSHPKEERGAIYRHSGGYRMIARLAPGATLTQAQAQLDGLTERLWADDPVGPQVRAAGFHVAAESLHKKFVRQARPMLVLLQCGAIFLLLVGAANLANLTLIRATASAREVAIRRTLGAGRLRVAVDGLIEAVLLACAGSAGGLILGSFGIRLMQTLGAERMPLAAFARMDARVALIGVAASLGICLLLSVPRLYVILDVRLSSALKADGRGSTPSRGMQRLRHGFIVGQVALAFMLLSAAGLFALSLARVMKTEPGFEPDGLTTAWIVLPPNEYPDQKAERAFIERLVAKLRELPGVENATVASRLPLADAWWGAAVVVDGKTSNAREAIPAHYVASVTDGYWATLGIPLLRGRLLRDSDSNPKGEPCVVDQAFADRYWPGEDPVGHGIAIGPDFPGPQPLTIMGVVGTVKENDLSETRPAGTVYIPDWPETAGATLSVAIRTPLPLSVAAPMIRRTAAGLDASLTVDAIGSMEARINKTLIPRRNPAILASIFAGLAVSLASIGTYGALAYAMSLRRKEIGLRMALGAMPRRIVAHFLRVGLGLAAAGLALGLLGAWGAARVIQSMLFGVAALQPGILLSAACVMIACIILSTLLPSRRAAKVNPAEALRSD
jgi:predicted permease